VIALVSQGLAFALGDTESDKLGKLERGLAVGGLASAEAMSLLAEFLGLAAPSSLAMSPDLQRRKTLELLAQWNLAMSEVQPLVVLVEDLHWCDASSLELLGRLVAQSPTARVLLLATARPEFTPPWPARSNLTTLQLARLTKRQARDMVTTLAGEELPADTLDALVARADGVPLYVEELTKAVTEPGAGRGVDAIPATLADSLMARLDRLSTAKEVAQRAAVLGREFSYPLLAAMAGLEEAALRQGLARLVDAEIVFARGEPPQATYTFKHALVQEAAYGSLLKRTRQQLHGRVVDVLIASFPERAAAEPEVVAQHAEVAGRIDDAIAHYQRAGEHAQARSAHEEAIRDLRHAIALLATRPEGAERDAREVALQLALGGSLVAARGFAHPEVEAAYGRAQVLCETVSDAGRLGRALIGLANFYSTRGEVERGRTLAARVLTAAEQSGDTELALHAHLQLALPEDLQGKFASSLAHCEAAQALYEPGRHHTVVSMLAFDPGVATLGHAAWDLWQLGWPDRALARAREAVVLARQLAHPFSLAHALYFETVVHWLRRDGTAQYERAVETIALSEAQGFPLWLAGGRTFHAAARAAGREPGAVADVRAGLALGAETGSAGGAPLVFALLGEAYLAAGQLAEARGAIEKGLGVGAQAGQPFFDADLLRLQGEIVLATGGAPADAAALFHRALEIARAQEAKSFELRAATSLARLLHADGSDAEGRALLAPIYGWFSEGFDTRDLVEAKTLLEQLSSC
jgi:tetratricopeptide (TPR) repeat protein